MRIAHWLRQFFAHWLDHSPVWSQYVISRWLFLRMLGVVYLIAFLSLGTQVISLAGENGIVPAKLRLQSIEQQLDAPQRYLRAPTLLWFGHSDAALQNMCTAGVVLSGLLIVGVAPPVVLIALWAVYLSLVVGCGVFLSFQWDTLLLETGLLAIVLAPMQLFAGMPKARAPSRVAIWLLRLLLLKLMFLSGITKITSGDETWRQLTALNYHYFTQPLPVWTAWYAHHLPLWFQKTSIVVMYVIELLVPLTMFAPRRVRHIGCALLVLLQLIIAATGNYGFFNLLTVVLCIFLLDDRLLRRIVPRRFAQTSSRLPETRVRRVGVAAFAAVVLMFSAFMVVHEIVRLESVPKPVRWIAPFRSINGYGLFRTMTTTRPEITLEASHDGKRWQAYTFKYKPGDVQRRPALVAPHMPRLDWQMWFAALGRLQHNPWLTNLMIRLLQNEPAVTALLADNPFGDNPPTFIRARLSRYEFATRQQREETGAWWTNEPVGDYSPIIMRDGDQFRVVRFSR